MYETLALVFCDGIKNNGKKKTGVENIVKGFDMDGFVSVSCDLYSGKCLTFNINDI